MEQLIVQLISGAVGGNVAGALIKNINQGTLINSLAGIVGGGMGGQIISAVLPGLLSGGMSLQGILSSVGSGGVGGAVLLVLVSIVRKVLKI